jgi:hypothetical protein
MYLSMFSKEKKELFLEFAYHIAKIDGGCSKEEESIMQLYANEMHLEEWNLSQERDIDIILNEIIECSEKRDLKIFVFEVLGLVLVDGVYDEREKALLNKVIDIFQLDNNYLQSCKDKLEKYLILQQEINSLVIEQGD